jgi:ABC-type nitrate/sulfonate/bicarbonate transport system substrate-binding protein
LNRRSFLKGSVALGGALAFGSSNLLGWTEAAEARPAAGQYGTLDLRLSWIENAQFAGDYIADTNGYYAAAGFSGVNLMPGGPTASPIESDVATGHAFIAPSQPDLTAQANLKGAKLKIVGALYQKNPFAILSLARNPIPTPKAMIGKKIGVQASNQVIWKAFLAANKIDSSQVKVVPVQFDLTPLTSGQVDGWFAFYNNEPLELQVKGYKTTTFLLADYGYPLSSQTYIVTDDNLKKNPDEIKAFLTAEIKGWKQALADPSLGAKLTVTKYGKTLGLDQKEQELEIKATRALAITPDTQKHGLLTMTPKLIADNIATLHKSGISIAASDLFDASLINELYKEDPSLR